MEWVQKEKNVSIFLNKGNTPSRTISPFRMCACWVIPGTGYAIPGTVRVSSQAAVSTGAPIHVTLMESDLGHGRSRSNVQLLL